MVHVKNALKTNPSIKIKNVSRVLNKLQYSRMGLVNLALNKHLCIRMGHAKNALLISLYIIVGNVKNALSKHQYLSTNLVKSVPLMSLSLKMESAKHVLHKIHCFRCKISKTHE